MTYFQDRKTGCFFPVSRVPRWVYARSITEKHGGDTYMLPADDEYTAAYISGQWIFEEV